MLEVLRGLHPHGLVLVRAADGARFEELPVITLEQFSILLGGTVMAAGRRQHDPGRGHIPIHPEGAVIFFGGIRFMNLMVRPPDRYG